ncbi:MAG: BamA/TamA family outer membrane protein [Ignavibacteriaceae bacterium]|nr:BamA/TamA family outer membrane protein [Ignavibacteriaceae bacterium]
MLLKSKYLFFILLLPSIIYSQKISELRIISNLNLPNSSFEKIISEYNNLTFNDSLVSLIKNKIYFEYREIGYYNLSFDPIKIDLKNDSSQIILSFSIKVKDPTFVNKIIITGLDSLELLIEKKTYGYLEDQIFIPSEIERTIQDALILFEQNGFPFTVVELSSLSFFVDSISNTNYVDIFINYRKGNYSRVDSIEISGNSDTEEYVIIREIGIKQGDPYNQKLIDDIPTRLNRLRFFQPVTEPVYVNNSKGKGILQIKIEEKQTNNFDGIIGFVPSQKKDESGYVTGMVNISMRNLFGTGRAAAFRWQKIDRLSQELEIKYMEPWIFGFPFNISTSVNQKIQDSSYVQRKIEGTLEYMADEDITLGLGLSSESIIPTVSDNSIFTVYNSSNISTGVSIKIDTRDDPYAPTRGFYLYNSYWLSNKRINGPTQYLTSETKRNLSLKKIFFDFSIFVEPFRRQVISLGIHAKELQASLYEPSDLYYLGGTNTLRGYRENQFQGSRIAWSNMEYRYLLSRRTFAFLFLDTGYYLRKSDEQRQLLENSGFKIGYGIGLNLETGLGVIAVSFALAKGETFSEGKIHFGLINEF